MFDRGMTMRLLTTGLFLAALPLAAADAQTRQGADPNCSDDRGVDRCSAEQHRRVLALYRLPPIERLHEQGAQVRRIFYVDGYGNDVIALSFVRAPGADPAVTVHYPRREGSEPREPLAAAVPARVWADVLARSEHFDRRLAPRAETEPNICIHSWVYAAEAADPPSWGRRAEIRRAVEDACSDGLVETLATAFAELAVPLFPHCAILDPDQHRNAASRLAACGMLSGDRHAAAEVLNKLPPLRSVSGAEDLRALGPLFLEEAVLDWNGRRSQGPAVAETWIGSVTQPRAGFFVLSAHGETADRVRVRGVLQRSSDGGYMNAPVEMVWLRTRGFGPRIERVGVGAFRAYRPPPRGD